MANVLALDIGGTKARAAVVDESRNSLFRVTVDTDPDSVNRTIEALLVEFSNQGWEIEDLVSAIGVAVAGNVMDGVLTGSGNLPGWTGCDLIREFRHVAQRPIKVLNDCTAAAFGEYSVFRTPLVYVIWGTGVGAAVASDDGGRVAIKSTELGHMIIDFHSDVKCGCGGLGHLEAYVGGGNLEAGYGKPVKSMTDFDWTQVLKTMAVGLRNISGGSLGMPIVLGGGVSLEQGHRLAELQELVTQLDAPAPVPHLSLSQLGDDSGLRGAAEAAFELLPL